jgi:hypothetical protein
MDITEQRKVLRLAKQGSALYVFLSKASPHLFLQ